MSIGWPKKKKIVSKTNLNFVKALPCFICGDGPSDPDHIKTRGSGGGDELENLNALCRKHHVERHKIGIKTFLDKYMEQININRDKFGLPEMSSIVKYKR